MEYFIQRVQNHPCLWNTNHIAYKDTARRDVAWERVAKECGMANGREAKIQWKKIRDSHREALRRRKNCAGGLNLRAWKYEDAMKFLLQPTDSSDISLNLYDPPELQDNTHHFTAIRDAENESKIVIDYTTMSSPNEFVGRESRKSSAEILEERDQRREMNREQREERRAKAIDENREKDALTYLFDSLCQKTRELPKLLQLRVQREIFETVNRAEEDALSLDSMNSYYRPMSSTSSYECNSASTSQFKQEYAHSVLPNQPQDSPVITNDKQADLHFLKEVK